MTERGLSQQELARRADIAQSTVNGYLKGNRSPGAAELCRLAVAVGVSMDWLWGMGETDKAERDLIKEENIKLRASLNLAIGTLEGALGTLKKNL